MVSTPWSKLLRLALVGTIIMALGVALDLQNNGGNIVGLVQPGADGPSVKAFEEDFPALELPDGIGHDGQQFYAIARAPMHFDEVSDDLDRPRYRLQRPLFPLLSWGLHPGGGGYGLVRAMALVGVTGVFLLGLGAGALSTRLGGGAWPAFVVPLLPGTYAALRLSLADTLALGLVLLALFAAEKGRAGASAILAVLGALAKESMLVVVIGHALFRRTRATTIAALVSTATTGLWWLFLRVAVEAESDQVLEFTWPFGGAIASADNWLTGTDWIAGLTVVGAFVLAGVALWRRGPVHPLFGALAATTLFSVFLGPDVLGPDFNGPRTIGPVLVLAILTLATPSPRDLSSSGRRGGSVQNSTEPVP